MSEKICANAKEFKETEIYYPKCRPGYTAWVSLFQFGNGDLGLAFNEIRRGKNPSFQPVTLEFAESMGLPYRSLPGILPACNPDLISEYVYMKSTDDGKTWQQTGRCPVHTRHYWHVGFPDGRMVRVVGTQQYRYEVGDDRFCNVIEESFDGGNSWKEISRIMHECWFYVHKFKKLSDGSIVAVGFQKQSIGPGGQVSQRNGVDVGQIAIGDACFLVSSDGGCSWDGPHYVLPGIESWEPFFVELPDGSLLFINSTVQGGRAVRQIVRRCSTGWKNDPMMEIRRGAPEDWEKNRQGGFVPETVSIRPDGLIVGARRCGSYSCSNDFGENWYEIAAPSDCQYQPIIKCLSDGRLLTAWHHGTDSAVGEYDMFIGTHAFEVEAKLPLPTKLTLERNLSADESQYINTFSARLTADGEPASGRKIELHVRDQWLTAPEPDGVQNPVDVWNSPDVRSAVTDDNGIAVFELKDKAEIADLHRGYQVAVSFIPKSGDELSPCKGPVRFAYPLTHLAAVRLHILFIIIRARL